MSLVECRDGRYRLHDLARDFAAARLRAEERQNAQRRHSGHYVEVLDRADRLYKAGGEELIAGLALFDREWRNVRAGQAWAAAHAGNDPEATKHCSGYPDRGAHYLPLRLRPRQRIEWIEAGRSAAAALGDRRKERNHLTNLGSARVDLGEPERAVECYRQHLEIAREIGDRHGEVCTSWNLGEVYEAQGELEQAVELMQICVDFEREIGHPDAEKDAARVDGIRARLAGGS